MLTDKEISKICRKYVVQAFCFVLILALLTILIATATNIKNINAPLMVASLFTFIVEAIDAIMWGKVKKNGDDGLPTFFAAVSGFRMLLALFTLFVCYLIVGRDAMTEYCVVFLCYYLLMIIHHSVFFSHLSNLHTTCDNEKR